MTAAPGESPGPAVTQAGEPSTGRGDGLRQRAITGVLWTATEKWSVRLSTLAAFVILGNLLSPLDFGVVAIAMTLINLLMTVADGGFASYLVQKKQLTAAATSTSFFVTSVGTLALALGLVALTPTLSDLLGVPELRSVLPALAVALFIAGLSVVPAALLTRELQFKQLALRQIVANLASVVVAIALALGGAGVWALVAQTLVRSTVALVILWATSRFRPRFTFDRREARAMVSFGSKSLGVNVQTQLGYSGQTMIIGALAGAVTVGYWTVANRLVSVVADIFSSVVGAVAHPVFAKLQDSPERLARALSSTRALSSLVLVPALVLLALVSEQVLPAVFGDQWTPTTTIASISALAALLQTVTNFDRAALLATGHPGAELAVTTVVMVAQLTLAVVFASDIEMLAAGIAACMALSIPVRMLIMRRLLSVPMRGIAPTAAVYLAGGVAAAAVLAAREAFDPGDVAYVVLAVLGGAVVYTGVVLLVARPVASELFGIVRGVVRRRSRTQAA